MHTIDPIEKADLTLLLGKQWKQIIQARNSKEGAQAKGVESMPLGRAMPPEKPSRPDTLEFVRPGFGVKVGKAGSLCKRPFLCVVVLFVLFGFLFCHQARGGSLCQLIFDRRKDNGTTLTDRPCGFFQPFSIFLASRIAILHGKNAGYVTVGRS